MGAKVAATTCFQWTQPAALLPHSPSSSSQTLAFAISPRKRRCRFNGVGAGNSAVVCRYAQRLDRLALLGAPLNLNLDRTGSSELPKQRQRRAGTTIGRACSASLDSFPDEEFLNKIQELALRFQLADDDDYSPSYNSDALDSGSDARSGSGSGSGSNNLLVDSESEIPSGSGSGSDSSVTTDSWNLATQFPQDYIEPSWEGLSVPGSIERKANSVDLPLSLRMIKRKMQWQEGFIEAGESAYCSVKRAFSSMVFIIRELHSYSMQMREFLFMEDLQGILARVQREMHASFVWLFQQVFSHTPTLMMYVMILLANFTVYSMGSNAAMAAAALPPPPAATEIVSVLELQDHGTQKFDSSSVNKFTVSSSGGKSASIGGNNGGGGRARPVGSGTDGGGGGGDGWLDRFSTIVPDGAQLSSSRGTTGEPVSGQVDREEELKLWNSIVEEASRMQAAALSDESLDHETMRRLVSPISAKIEPDDDYEEYSRTDLLYQTGVLQEPKNPLLLANYAQFLYLVARDYDRAEEYFKRAIEVEPPDAEAYGKYASFLWRARNDLWAAEETFLEAISADPSNSHYAANYAHFLWNTGGEDTCFPISSPEEV
ncbi:hypothetical protein Tsubulata_024105 [Turnera subulata]|uniref:Uncharacterized protein n=1 Tax=Turnera subulata TaxID=218843 RepID=A0A9Q0EZK7_9ROSI|nr:hypothetical protein Tsubulata_024105 [Turnera subulata]